MLCFFLGVLCFESQIFGQAIKGKLGKWTILMCIFYSGVRRGKELSDGWEESDYQINSLLVKNFPKLSNPACLSSNKENIQHLPFWFLSPAVLLWAIGSLEIKFLLCPAEVQRFCSQLVLLFFFLKEVDLIKFSLHQIQGLKKGSPSIRQNTLSSCTLQKPTISIPPEYNIPCVDTRESRG